MHRVCNDSVGSPGTPGPQEESTRSEFNDIPYEDENPQVTAEATRRKFEDLCGWWMREKGSNARNARTRTLHVKMSTAKQNSEEGLEMLVE